MFPEKAGTFARTFARVVRLGFAAAGAPPEACGDNDVEPDQDCAFLPGCTTPAADDPTRPPSCSVAPPMRRASNAIAAAAAASASTGVTCRKCAAAAAATRSAAKPTSLTSPRFIAQ
jgi:hypothetical protein